MVNLFKRPVVIGMVIGFFGGMATGWTLHMASVGALPAADGFSIHKPVDGTKPEKTTADSTGIPKNSNSYTLPRTKTTPDQPKNGAGMGLARSDAPMDEPDTSPMGRKSEEKLKEMALNNPEELTEYVLANYRFDSELDTYQWLADMIAAGDALQVKDFSFRMAGSEDPNKRRLGFELLQNASVDDPDVRDLLLYSLENEYDPDVLTLAVRAANPALLPKDDVSQFSDKFRELTHHEDPRVRGQSIVALAAWDKENRDVAAYINDGLHDTSSLVVNSALAALTETHLQDQTIRTSLWDIASDAGAVFETRETAVRLLSQCPLDDEARARLKGYADELSDLYSYAEMDSN